MYTPSTVPPAKQQDPKALLISQRQMLAKQEEALKTLIQKSQSLGDCHYQVTQSSLFCRKVNMADSGVITPTSTGLSPIGRYEISVQTLPSFSKITGSNNAIRGISDGSNLNSILITQLPCKPAIKTGFFMLSGKKIQIEANSTLQDLFETITDTTIYEVHCTYNTITNTIVFESQSTIFLGSANDSTDFLSALQLFSNGTNRIESRPIGSFSENVNLADLALQTALIGTGEFTINGEAFSYNSTDSFKTIANSVKKAKVSLEYKPQSRSFSLTNTVTGSFPIHIQDLSGNFLAALGLLQGTLALGNNASLTINGSTCMSHSKTVDESSHGLAAINLELQTLGSNTLTVEMDLDASRKHIEETLIKAYNELWQFFKANSQSITLGNQRIKGPLDDNDISQYIRELKNIIFNGTVEDLSLHYLHQAGLQFNPQSELVIQSTELLKKSLTESSDELYTLLKHVLKALYDHIQVKTGENGVLKIKQQTIIKQMEAINKQIQKEDQNALSREEKRKKDEFTVQSNIGQSNRQASMIGSHSIFPA